jgi:hypothetical protein
MNPADHQLDLERRSRLGMVEAIWGEHKSVDQLVRIFEALAQEIERRVAARDAAHAHDALLHAQPLGIALLRLVQRDVRLDPLDLRGRRVLEHGMGAPRPR